MISGAIVRTVRLFATESRDASRYIALLLRHAIMRISSISVPENVLHMQVLHPVSRKLNGRKILREYNAETRGHLYRFRNYAENRHDMTLP
jgi:hypothetical protein